MRLARRLRWTAICVIVGLAGPPPGGVAARAPAASGDITIGVASVFDFVSDWMRKGAQFAADDVNAAGGVLGRKIRLVFEQDSALGQRGVRSLLSSGVDALVAPEVWTATQNNDQLIRNHRTLTMLPLSPSGSVNQLRNPYVFRLLPSDAQQAEALVDFLAGTRSLRRFAILRSDDFLGREGAGEVRDRLRLRGLRPVFESTFNMGDVEFTTQVSQAQRSGAEALIVWGLAREAARIAVTVRNLGWKVQLAGPVEAVLADYIDLAGSAADGTVGVLPHKTINNWAPPGSFRANWFARYHRRFVIKAFRGTHVPNLPVAQAVVYDAVRLYADAVRFAKTTDPDAVRKVLESGRTFAEITQNFAFSPGNHEAYAAGDLWAFRIAKGAVNFDIDPRADKDVETQAWQLFAAGLLFDRTKGTAFIPYSIGVFPQSAEVNVAPFVWRVTSLRFVPEIAVGSFGIAPVVPKGRFAIVHVRVTNASSQTRKAPWTFAIDQDGNLSIPDARGMAAMWVAAPPESRFFIFTPLAPGASLEGDFVYDVASTATRLQVGVPDGFIFQNYAMVRVAP